MKEKSYNKREGSEIQQIGFLHYSCRLFKCNDKDGKFNGNTSQKPLINAHASHTHTHTHAYSGKKKDERKKRFHERESACVCVYVGVCVCLSPIPTPAPFRSSFESDAVAPVDGVVRHTLPCHCARPFHAHFFWRRSR